MSMVVMDDLGQGGDVLQMQIRISAIVLALFMSIGLVVGSILLRPALTQTLYIKFAALIAGAGLLVTAYNHLLTRRRSPVEPSFQESALAADSSDMYTAASVDVVPAEVSPSDIPVLHPTEDVPEEQVVMTEELLPDDLDDLLDMAFEAAEEDPLHAVAAYQRALERYPNDSYMPYLIIELSTLYKRLGNYDAALALFDQALALPLIAKNAAMAQEFRRSQKALAAVSHMLAARGTPALPFGEVPKELLAEADRRADAQTTSDIFSKMEEYK